MTDVLTLGDRVAEEIRVVMARKRVNQSELARRIGVSVMWVNGRLNGDTQIAINDLPRIAAALEVPTADLLPAELRSQPNVRLDAIEKTAGRRNPKRRPERPNKRREPAPTRPVSAVPPSQRRPCPVRPAGRRMAN